MHQWIHKKHIVTDNHKQPPKHLSNNLETTLNTTGLEITKNSQTTM